MREARAAIEAVPPRGYRWWYVDGLSDDGRRGFTAIFLIGSVFSPAYATRVRRGEAAHPTEHLGVHVALYEDGRPVAWTMTEYPASALSTTECLQIGSSSLAFASDGALRGEIAERSSPIFWSLLGMGARIRGSFDLRPSIGAGPELELTRTTKGEAHRWQVRSASARISVRFEHPRFAFEGRAYHDSNWGDGPLEAAFQRWSWARFHDEHGSRVLYALQPRDGEARGYVVEPGSSAFEVKTASFGATRPIGWGLRAPDHFEVGGLRAEVAQVLDRSPFYARYVARLGSSVGVGEYLDLDRFQRPGVQFLLNFRTRRRREKLTQ